MTAVRFLADVPRVIAYNNSGRSVATSTWTTMVWDTCPKDTDTMFSSGSSRLTIATSGQWAWNACVTFPANATGVRFIRWRVNAGGSVGSGTGMAASRLHSVTANAAPVNLYFEAYFNQGDYLELFCFQSSGSTLTTSGGETYASARWVAQD